MINDEMCDVSQTLERSELHLNEFQRVVAAFPVPPPHTGTVRAACFVVVAVEAGLITTTVPPGSFAPHCTRARPLVVVLVFSAELHSTMIC